MSGAKQLRPPPAQRARTTSQAFEIRFKKGDSEVQIIDITPDRRAPDERALPTVFSRNDILSGQSVPTSSKSSPVRSALHGTDSAPSTLNMRSSNSKVSVLNYDEVVIPTVARRRKTMDDLKVLPDIDVRLDKTVPLPIAIRSRSKTASNDKIVAEMNDLDELMDLDRDGLVPDHNITDNETTLTSTVRRGPEHFKVPGPVVAYDEMPIPTVAKRIAMQNDRLDDQVVPLAQPTTNIRAINRQPPSQKNTGFRGSTMGKKPTSNSVIPFSPDDEESATKRDERSGSPTAFGKNGSSVDTYTIDSLAPGPSSGLETVESISTPAPVNFDDMLIPTVAKRVAMEKEQELARVREGEREVRRAEQRKQRKHEVKKAAAAARLARLAITGSSSSPTSAQSRRNSKRMSIKRVSRADLEDMLNELQQQESQDSTPAIGATVDALESNQDAVNMDIPSLPLQIPAPSSTRIVPPAVPIYLEQQVESYERQQGNRDDMINPVTFSEQYDDQTSTKRRREEYELRQRDQNNIIPTTAHMDNVYCGEVSMEPKSKNKFICCVIS
ncbi:hypothetical protein BC937DRAFT_92177 [Endogone sp. FLAS-F59071]|nr:hypothetical protein BC937DRAFT_92177 [Endogone sp. FLAS-F59071]|eukprot:RUS21577.1 hypothetical protein BC937DRAFT_92177 [Endogone sp. FLAS-F59071]